MSAAPQEYGGGPGTPRPESGHALVCWQTAREQLASSQDSNKSGVISGGFSTGSSGPSGAPTPVGQTPEGQKKSSSSARWIWGCLIIGMGIICTGAGFFLLLKPSAPNFAGLTGPTATHTATPLPPTDTPVPPTATATFPPGPRSGHYEGTRPFVSFDITDEGNIANFALNAPFAASTCNIKIEKIEVVDAKFVLNVTTADKEQATIGIFTIKGQIEGTEASGTHNITFCGRTIAVGPADQPWKAEWKGSSVLPTKAAATPVVEKPAPTKTQKAIVSNPDRPVIRTVTLRKDKTSGQLVIYQDIFFSDKNGDVIRVDYHIDSTTNPDVQVEGGTIDISSAQQRAGVFITGEWSCGDGYYMVDLSVTLTDRAGNQSEPYPYKLICD